MLVFSLFLWLVECVVIFTTIQELKTIFSSSMKSRQDNFYNARLVFGSVTSSESKNRSVDKNYMGDFI